MRSGATSSAGRAKKAWGEGWEVLGGPGGYGSAPQNAAFAPQSAYYNSSTLLK